VLVAVQAVSESSQPAAFSADKALQRRLPCTRARDWSIKRPMPGCLGLESRDPRENVVDYRCKRARIEPESQHEVMKERRGENAGVW